ncbi:Solute-binding protein [subsurface metagenome]
MKKNLIILSMVLIIMLLVGSTSLAAEFVLNLGHGAAVDNPRNIVAQEYADWVYKQTDGKVKINIQPGESIGSDREMMESIIMGTLDMSVNSQGAMAIFDKRIGVFGLPFLFKNMEEIEIILGGPFGEKFAEMVNKDNKFEILGFFDNGFRFITNDIRPINEPNDLKGLKIRTPEDDMTLAIFKTLGAKPSPLAFGELYLALSQGVFDGQENPPVNIYYNRFYEVQKYLSKSGHKYEMCPLIISDAIWNKLPSDIQEILKEGAKDFSKRHREINAKLNNELLDKLREEGMKINEVDKEKFQKATAGIYDQFKDVFGAELISNLQDELKNLRK